MSNFFVLYKITKIGSVDNPTHPESNFGESLPYHIGYFTGEPIVGERFNLGYINHKAAGISTSMVTKIINNKRFETLNSIYEYEKLTNQKWE